LKTTDSHKHYKLTIKYFLFCELITVWCTFLRFAFLCNIYQMFKVLILLRFLLQSIFRFLYISVRLHLRRQWLPGSGSLWLWHSNKKLIQKLSFCSKIYKALSLNSVWKLLVNRQSTLCCFRKPSVYIYI
jgi:hypothetical protein